MVNFCVVCHFYDVPESGWLGRVGGLLVGRFLVLKNEKRECDAVHSHTAYLKSAPIHTSRSLAMCLSRGLL